MRVKYTDVARRLGVSPLQVLVELASMNQPWEDCWPACDEGFVETLTERRRVRAGLAPRAFNPAPEPAPTSPVAALPVSDGAAAILDKLMRKSYGLKSVRIFTLLKKWVHDSKEEDIEELVERGNLQWTDPSRSSVNLAANRLHDTEGIVDIYRRKGGG